MSEIQSSECWVVEGLISCGKTTLLKTILDSDIVRERFDEVILYPEPIKKKTLDIYLGNRADYALSFQVITLIKRLSNLKDIRRLLTEKKRRLILMDRGVLGDRAFETMQVNEGFFTETDHAYYMEEIGEYDGELAKLLADAMFRTIYLRCSPATAFRRLKMRGDPAEVAGYTLKYFEELYKAHEAILARPGIVQIDWENDRVIENSRLSADDVRGFLEKINFEKK